MLRGWKSASGSGFPALSSSTGGDVIEGVGNLPATKTIPMLSNQRLRPVLFMNSPVSFDRAAMHFLFRSTSSISFTFACQSGIKLRVRGRLRQMSTRRVALEKIEPLKARGTY
jgi:hypothetical protein